MRRSFVRRAVTEKAWVANVCLFSHIFSGLVRYCEAKEMIRSFLDSMSRMDDYDDQSDYHSCVGESDISTTASDFDSASEGEHEQDAWDIDSDYGTIFAVPGENLKMPIPCWKGTRGREPGRRIEWYKAHSRGLRAVCDSSSIIDYSLVDGSWRREDRAKGTTESAVRAVGRARQQRCEVLSELPTSGRARLHEEHPTIPVKRGEDVLILDAFCSWSNTVLSR